MKIFHRDNTLYNMIKIEMVSDYIYFYSLFRTKSIEIVYEKKIKRQLKNIEV